MYSSASYTNYFLVDKDYNIVFETFCSDESEIEEEQLVQLERIFGGYYVVRSVYSHCIATYPGQDRDTLYSYSIYIKDVLDENGVSLSKEKKDLIPKEYNRVAFIGNLLPSKGIFEFINGTIFTTYTLLYRLYKVHAKQIIVYISALYYVLLNKRGTSKYMGFLFQFTYNFVLTYRYKFFLPIGYATSLSLLPPL